MNTVRLRKRGCTATGTIEWQIAGTCLALTRGWDGWRVRWITSDTMDHRDALSWLSGNDLLTACFSTRAEAARVVFAHLAAHPSDLVAELAGSPLTRQPDGSYLSACRAWTVHKDRLGWLLTPATSSARRRVERMPVMLAHRKRPRTLHEAAQHIAQLNQLI